MNYNSAMTIGIICFSGTGNTRKIAKEFERHFMENGHEVLWRDLEDRQNTDFPKLDLLLIAYPVHAFNAPEPVIGLAKTLITHEKTPLVIVKTSGEPLRLNASSSDLLIRILRKRNFMVVGEYWYVMPYNIIFRHSDGMAWRMWETARRRIASDVKWLLNGGEHHLNTIPGGRFLTFLFRIEHWGARMNGRLFRVSSSCINCGRCSRACPQKNITENNGKPCFGSKCVLCMRCVMNCPARAISIGLLKGWEVYGQYSFIQKDEDNSIRYCKRAYERYFNELR